MAWRGVEHRGAACNQGDDSIHPTNGSVSYAMRFNSLVLFFGEGEGGCQRVFFFMLGKG